MEDRIGTIRKGARHGSRITDVSRGRRDDEVRRDGGWGVQIHEVKSINLLPPKDTTGGERCGQFLTKEPAAAQNRDLHGLASPGYGGLKLFAQAFDTQANFISRLQETRGFQPHTHAVRRAGGNEITGL